MFFQINVTPKEKKSSKVKDEENNKEEVETQQLCELVLAPFQPQTRINLNSTINNPVKCCLKVKNPSNRNLEATVSKLPPAERSVYVSVSELSIATGSKAEIEISWTPRESGSWRETLQLTDNRRVKYDVALILSAASLGKKTQKGKSRVLVPANTNERLVARNAGQPVVRELKRSVPLDKENVPKAKASRGGLEVRQTTKLSQSSHNFSAIINSTKFNISPIKEKDELPEIEISSCTEMNVLSDKTRNGQATRLAHEENHEFSVIMNSTTFNLTPFKPRGSPDGEKTGQQLRIEKKKSFSPQDVGILSPEMLGLPMLRRETYVTGKCAKSIGQHIAEDPEAKKHQEENFLDSLSPQPEGDEKEPHKASDFSVLINDMKFLTPQGPGCREKAIFSPADCSTGNRTRSIGKSAANETSSLNLAGNDTFDLSNSRVANNSGANGTYELSTSPTSSKNLDAARPSRVLSQSFDPMSPADKKSEHLGSMHTGIAFSSTPVCREVFPTRFSTRPGISHTPYKNEDVSVKQVLEADLWAKSEPELHFTASMTSTSIRCGSLDRINEEGTSPEKVFFVPLDRTKTLPPAHQAKSTRFRKFEFSPPKKCISGSGMSGDRTRRVSPTKGTKIRKDKKLSEPSTSFRKKVQINCTIKRGRVSIPGVRIANLSLARLNQSHIKEKSVRIEPKETSVQLHDPNDCITRFCNPDSFAATMTHDPFLSSSVYYDEQWMEKKEREFKKWLNKLLTPPEQLSADVDSIRVDVGKVWQSCRNREDVTLAETREAVSARYHTNTRLNTLRKAACAMFRRDEVAAALSKATVCVERGTLMIRQDRDLHRDIGLQKEILELFLSYNPLWLRIGLETIYGETIPLHSNNDLVGLTRFLIARFFSDPFIVKTHSHATILSLKLGSFPIHMNKFILKKFLLIVYFLDYAKRNKLIGHDPCLFHKRASHKESRAILLSLAREVLSGVGDLTKLLRTHGYVVSHKQTYLDEYDYAVKDIATDLRDGVRLCRVMELVSGDRNLTPRCRVPAISRLQKVHNVDLSLGALQGCGYTLTGDIDAKSIADGHREKTLSLLWQIIYKYQQPRFEKAANTIRKWWRASLWYIRIRNYLRNRREDAASRIQRAWRCHRARRMAEELREERRRRWAKKEQAIRVIQIQWIQRKEMLRDRRNFLATKNAVVCLQRCFRRRRDCATFVEEFRGKRQAVKTIQDHWRAHLLAKMERARYSQLLDSTRTIQRLWRARQAGRRELRRWKTLKRATIVVQSRWRALRSMRDARESFRTKIQAARTIQTWWRRSLRLKRDRNEFLLKKHAVRTIERWRISQTSIIIERNCFKAKRQATILIQRNFRRYLQTRNSVEHFRIRVRAIKVIQRWWRCVRVAKRYRIQKKSCIVIQRWWRGCCATRMAITSFGKLRRAAIAIQATWRMKRARRDFVRMRNAAKFVQASFRNARLSSTVRQEFTAKRTAAVKLQSWWRTLQIARKEETQYLEYRRKVIIVQTQWRAILIARKTRIEYLRIRKVLVNVQASWRMVRQRKVYLELLRRHKAAEVLQKRWRELLAARDARKKFLELRSACILLQKRLRDLRLTRETRLNFIKQRRAAIVIQTNFRMLRTYREFQSQKEAAVILQERWRARKRCLEVRHNYLRLKGAAIKMQLRYKANKEALRTREEHLELRSAVVNVQRRWRANKSMEEAKSRFSRLRQAAIVLQSQWRMLMERRSYLETREAVVTLQTRWRAAKTARRVREDYQKLRRSVLFLQERRRANDAGKVARRHYERTRLIIVWMQRRWRAKLEHRLRDEAAINIQTWWRSLMEMRECRHIYQKKKHAVLVLQRRYRAHRIASEVRKSYLHVIVSVVKLQRCCRFLLNTKRHKVWLRKREIAVSVMDKWRRLVFRRKTERAAELAQLQKEHAAATKIQTIWRGRLVRRRQSAAMKNLRERSKRAAEAAVPSATIAFQFRQSMDTLQHCKTIAQLCVCFSNLDTLTRLSYNGCILFCELNFVDKVYGTIAMANRSIPWLEVCNRCTSILITLAKLPETKKYCYRVDQMETLARLMTVAIDHHVDLFLRLATLLWLLSENEEYATAVTNCSRTMWILRNLSATSNKKKSKTQPGMANKSMASEETALLPNSKPDWGLKHKRPRLFTTVHHAMASIMKRLESNTAP